MRRLRQHHITIKVCILQFHYIVECHTHNMRCTYCCTQVRRTITDNKIFGRNKHRTRSLHGYIPIYLFKCRTCQWQTEKHSFNLVSILGHNICNKIIHVTLYTHGLLFFFFGYLADNLRPHRTACWHNFTYCL